MKLKLKTTIFLLLMAVSLSLSASTTFSEDFDRHNSVKVGSGWFEIERNINDVRIKDEKVILRDNKSGPIDAGLLRVLNGDYSLSTLSFDWKPLIKSDWTDTFSVSYAKIIEGEYPLFTEIFSTSLGDNSRKWTSTSLSLNGTPINSPFILMFSTKLDGRNNRLEGVRLDNINITSPVPVPPVGILAGLVGSILLIQRKHLTN